MKFPLGMLLLVSCLAEVAHVNTAAQTYTTKVFTTNDGLPANDILTTYQDSYGYIWIGTSNGLARFDGSRMIRYTVSQGLPSNRITTIFEDKQNRLWIGTREGISEFKKDSFFVYPTNDKQKIRFVPQFYQNEKQELSATTDAGYYVYRHNQWEKKSLIPGHEDNPVTGIFVAKDSFICYANRELFRKTENGSYRDFWSERESPTPIFNSLFTDHDTLYIGTHHILYQIVNGIKRPMFEKILTDRFIFSFFKDSRGLFWIGTEEDGIMIIDPTKPYEKPVTIPLAFNQVIHFTEDKFHRIWASNISGLIQIKKANYQTVSFKEISPNHFIRHIISLPDGTLLVSVDDGRQTIISWDSEDPQSYRVIQTFKMPEKDDFIDYYTIDDKNNLWFVTRNRQLFELSEGQISNKNGISTSGYRNDYRDIAYNKTLKKLIVCTEQILLIGDENKLDTFFDTGTKEIIRSPDKIEVNPDGSMIVNTYTHQTFFISTDKRITKQIPSPFSELSPHGKIKTDNDGNIFMYDREGGIAIFKNKPNDVLERIDEIRSEEGIDLNPTFDYMPIHKNQVWIIINSGITFLAKNNNENQWSNIEFEIPEFNTATPQAFSKFAVDKNRNIWTNLKNTLLVFAPVEGQIQSPETKVIIERIQINDQDIKNQVSSDSGVSYLQIPQNPTFKYFQNTITIGFNAIHERDKEQTEYSYKLIPTDTTWSTPNPNTTISFYKLNPDTYTFEVRARIRGLAWSSDEKFHFKIEKPIWDEWWFRTMIVLLASAGVAAAFRSRIRHERYRASVKQKFQELEMQALRSQMNPHFIHNALNSIQALVMNHQNEEATRYISKFGKLLRQVLENADKKTITLEKELDTVRLYVQLEKLRMGVDIEYIEEIGEEVMPENIKVPPFIFQPFIENSLWHGLSNKSGDKIIKMCTHEDVNWVTFTITDNGIGRKKSKEIQEPQKKVHQSLGIELTRKRINDFNHVTDHEAVTFIDLTDQKGPTGTQVTIRIKKDPRT